MPADRAHAHRPVAPPVEEQDALFPVLQVAFEFLHQASADLPGIARGKLCPHINEIHGGQRTAAVPLGQCDKPETPRLSRMISLGARGG